MAPIVSRLLVAAAVASGLSNVVEGRRIGEADEDLVLVDVQQHPGKSKEAKETEKPPKKKPIKGDDDDDDDDNQDDVDDAAKPAAQKPADDDKPVAKSEKKEEKKSEDACSNHGTPEELAGWFKRAKKMLAAQPGGGDDYPDGDGSKDKPAWGYLRHDCMKNRHRKTIAEMADKQCNMILEVGGYLTPLIDFVVPPAAGKDGKSKEEKAEQNMAPPPLYVNVDPSMDEASMEARGPTCIMHLPMTLQDFMGDKAKTLREQFNIHVSREAPQGPTCAVLMGLWTPQLSTKKDKAAVAGLFHNSTFGAIESPNDELKHFEEGTKLAKSAGQTPYKDDEVDCYEAMDKKTRKSTAVRQMRFFVVEGGKGKGKGKEEVKKELDKKEKEEKPEKVPTPSAEDDMEKFCKFRNGKHGKKRKENGDHLDCAPIMSCEWKPDPEEKPEGGLCVPAPPAKEEAKKEQ